MDFKGTIYQTKRHGGVESYLISPENVQAFLKMSETFPAETSRKSL